MGIRWTLEEFQRWGKTGGKTRAKKLTPAERSKIARKAARARWSKKGETRGKP